MRAGAWGLGGEGSVNADEPVGPRNDFAMGLLIGPNECHGWISLDKYGKEEVLIQGS